MILSGQDIKKYNLLLNAEESNMQAQGWDVRLDKVYRCVNKPWGQKIKEEDYVEPVRYYEKSFRQTCIAQVWNDAGNLLYYWIPPESSVLFKLMETVDLSKKTYDPLQRFNGADCDPEQKLVADTLSLFLGKQSLKVPTINALVLPKSSLSRRGISVHSAWWDAGYKGSGVVFVRTSEVPLQIKPGDSFGQMIFFEGTPTDSVYNGQYQGEGIPKKYLRKD
ncbi:MAG: hypothetical protein M0R80_03855 [Proteobacteria bacterium]|nr:hypothetical protein [Pseudomonadota bacterium]